MPALSVVAGVSKRSPMRKSSRKRSLMGAGSPAAGYKKAAHSTACWRRTAAQRRAAGGRGRGTSGRQLGLDLVADLLEGLRLLDGQVGQHLAVQLDPGQLGAA